MSLRKARVFPSGENCGAVQRPMRAIDVTVVVRGSVASVAKADAARTTRIGRRRRMGDLARGRLYDAGVRLSMKQGHWPGGDGRRAAGPALCGLRASGRAGAPASAQLPGPGWSPSLYRLGITSR